MDIRPLVEADLDDYKALRIGALAAHPEAFGETTEEMRVRSREDELARLFNGAVYGLFDGKALVGLTGYYRMAESKKTHSGGIWTVYVAPAYRKQGHGKNLMRAAIAHARREGKEYLELGVTAGNDGALHMYESMGFTVYGRRPGLLKIDGKNYDENLMILKL
jgi:ribosomal protein S18 acetylase RimI-like enzyme